LFLGYVRHVLKRVLFLYYGDMCNAIATTKLSAERGSLRRASVPVKGRTRAQSFSMFREHRKNSVYTIGTTNEGSVWQHNNYSNGQYIHNVYATSIS
jgi:hypothetical protein